MSTNLLNELANAGFKRTKQRIAICEVLELDSNDKHMTVEDINNRAFGYDANVATTYRCLKDMENLGLIESHDFGDGRIRYEVAKKPHGHLVNINNNVVHEFDLTVIIGLIKAEMEKVGLKGIEKIRVEVLAK